MANRAQIMSSAAALLAFLNTEPAAAQGLQSSETIEAIVGTPVHEQEVQASAEPERVIAAIEKTEENISTVRKTTILDTVDIVFLPDAAPVEGGPPQPIQEKLAEYRSQLDLLRGEIEGNAMLYHAIDSRQVLIRDVMAVEFKDRNVVIYAAAKPAQTLQQ
jgi:hypothetical protein